MISGLDSIKEKIELNFMVRGEYEKFKKYIKALRISNKATSELFQKYDDDGILDVTSADVICEMLMEMTGDDKRWIEHFLMNCDCDYDDGCAYWFDADGGKHEIDGDRDLYDLVTGKKFPGNKKCSYI